MAQLGTFFVADGVDYQLGVDRACVQLRTMEGRVQQPSTLLHFTVDDCSGRPLSGLEMDDFEIFEGDNRLSVEAVRRILPQDGMQAFVSLVLDLSVSTRNQLDEMIAGATSFVRL